MSKKNNLSRSVERSGQRTKSKKSRNDRKKASQVNHEIALGLFDNALDFISSSLDPILSAKSDTQIKYSILHLHAGVELILKQILFDEHWSLIFANTDKAKKESLENGDFLSVNQSVAMDRLINICGLNLGSAQQKSLNQLREKRNQIVHFAFKANKLALKALVSEVLIVVLDLIDECIVDEDKSKHPKVLMEIREKSRQFSLFAKKKMSQLTPRLKQWESKGFEILTCPSCLQKALVFNEDLECLFCGYTDTPEKIAYSYVVNVMGFSGVMRPDEEDYFPLEECPACEMRTLVFRDQDAICFSCLESWDNSDLDNCPRCGRIHVYKEGDVDLCKDCWDDVLSRD